ncbi:hypothetical protein AGMMS49992_08780 [Clostridia bacterium]|nr:hypothetical protein AGMMS49992_08780 [Clostridia bacterium]
MAESSKSILWLFIAQRANPDLCYALPATAWAADSAGVSLECYLECERQGNLFAQTGSTVLGGHHHQQFNYLHAVFDVRLLILGSQNVFASSSALFGDDVMIDAASLDEYYEKLFSLADAPACALFAPTVLHRESAISNGDFSGTMHNAPAVDQTALDVSPYLYMDIYFSKAVAYPTEEAARRAGASLSIPVHSLWASNPDDTDDIRVIDQAIVRDDYGSITLRAAKRWQCQAQGVAFGDPDAIRAQIPTLCREKRVAVYAPVSPKPAQSVELAAYTENASAIALETARLARAIGNPVMVGRQTGDADLFAWGKEGVSLQIMDPNRPAFPIVATIRHKWADLPGDIWEDEPDDAQLRLWASEGRVLSSLVFHSGEMAHNEAMLNLIDLCSAVQLKLGIATHLARYKTCPQQWELLQIPIAQGGVRGRIEPILHSGGLGVMAEADCPPEDFAWHCREALKGIAAIAGERNLPRGYYFFCDTDLPTLSQTRPGLYSKLQEVGLSYGISSALPGRNRLLNAPIPVLTQTSRTQCQGSPFIRITTREDVRESGFAGSPGWFIGVLDAPVISFTTYIWKYGSRFMELVDFITRGSMINVLPNTIARYAIILEDMKTIPKRLVL